MICFWGLLRSLQYTYDSIHRHCLAPILRDGHSYSIYVHTYQFAGNYSNPRNDEEKIQLNFSDWHRLRPDYVYVENQDEFDESFDFASYESMGDPWDNNFTSFKNHFRALHSLHHLSQVIRNESLRNAVDGVILLRPDVFYLNELPYQLMAQYNHTLFLPDFHRNCRGSQVNDRVAMGDVNSVIVYASRIEAALEYSKTHIIESETFTRDHLINNHVNIIEMPFRFHRIRADGHVCERDSTLISPQEQFAVSPSGRIPNPTPYIKKLIYGGKKTNDDPHNIYCSPYPRVWYKDWLKTQRARSKSIGRNDSAGAIKGNHPITQAVG